VVEPRGATTSAPKRWPCFNASRGSGLARARVHAVLGFTAFEPQPRMTRNAYLGHSPSRALASDYPRHCLCDCGSDFRRGPDNVDRTIISDCVVSGAKGERSSWRLQREPLNGAAIMGAAHLRLVSDKFCLPNLLGAGSVPRAAMETPDLGSKRLSEQRQRSLTRRRASPCKTRGKVEENDE